MLAADFAWAFALQLPLWAVTCWLVREPYMDEYFHHRQAVEIAAHPVDPYWDDKITTPPGLYYVSLLLSLGQSNLYALRLTSLAFNSASFALLCVLAPNRDRALAFRIMSFPPTVFFSQLYYTDAGGLFFVLLGLYFSQKATRDVPLALLALTVAVWFRQTNLVWMVCVGGMQFLLDWELQGKWYASPRFWKASALAYSGYVAIPLVYLLHVRRQSSSLVFGDQSNHQLSLHLAQLCYLSVVLCSSQWRLVFARPKPTLLLLGTTIAALLFVHYFTLTHPFLLADNRHFSFYLWSKFLRRTWYAKYLPVPAYGLALNNAITAMYVRYGGYQALAFGAACVLAVVPLPLFEFRYFIVPYVLFSLLTGARADHNGVVVTTMLHIQVVCTVQYVFWFWTFAYADGSVGRFMW